MEVVNASAAATQAAKLLEKFRETGLPVFHVQHISTRPGAAFFLPDTEGIDFSPHVEPLPSETIIQKNYPNSFRSTQLESLLKASGTRRLVICGMMSHMCIDATVRAAFDKEFQCIVVHDACATRELAFDGMGIEAQEVHGAFMAALGAVYAQVMSLDETLMELKHNENA